MTHEPLIAIVDDDDSFREAVLAFLQSTGRRAVAFSSADAFLTSGAPRAVDCLLLDLRMPRVSGQELQQRLLATGHRIPTIVITAHADEATRARMLATGATAV